MSTGGQILSLLRLGWMLLRIGALAFGGLGATLALIERDVVERRGLVSREEVPRLLRTRSSYLARRLSKSSHTSAGGSEDGVPPLW